MAKRNIHSDELAVETTDNELYRRNPDGTYTKITSNGAMNSHETGSDVPPPESWSVDYPFSGTVAALGTTGVISSYSKGTLVISGLTSETINVTALIGSAQTLETAALRLYDANTGALAAAAALGNGTYKFSDLVAHKLKFTKSATSETAVVTLTLKA